MATVNQIARSGNIITLMFDGQQVGLIQSLSAQDDYSPEPASGIGSIKIQEYVPTVARHSVQVSGVLLRTNSMLELGLIAENGDAMLDGAVFDIVVADKETGTVLRVYSGCSYASGSIEVQKHAMIMQSAQFNALDVRGTA